MACYSVARMSRELKGMISLSRMSREFKGMVLCVKNVKGFKGHGALCQECQGI